MSGGRGEQHWSFEPYQGTTASGFGERATRWQRPERTEAFVLGWPIEEDWEQGDIAPVRPTRRQTREWEPEEGIVLDDEFFAARAARRRRLAVVPDPAPAAEPELAAQPKATETPREQGPGDSAWEHARLQRMRRVVRDHQARRRLEAALALEAWM